MLRFHFSRSHFLFLHFFYFNFIYYLNRNFAHAFHFGQNSVDLTKLKLKNSFSKNDLKLKFWRFFIFLNLIELQIFEFSNQMLQGFFKAAIISLNLNFAGEIAELAFLDRFLRNLCLGWRFDFSSRFCLSLFVKKSFHLNLGGNIKFY